MEPVNVFGVDYSGAKREGSTWLTQAELEVISGSSTLKLNSCEPIKREDLTDFLKQLPSNSVAALDFPFGVPMEFANYWEPNAKKMPDLWRAASNIDRDDFENCVKRFISGNAEYLRVAESNFPRAFSPLHRVNPNMLPMTFHGMSMLHQLCRAPGFHVPPLPEQNGDSRVLLECMPGATLGSFKLPATGYKKGQNHLELRKQILRDLGERSGIDLPNLHKFRAACLGNDDCLDSVIAAVTAARWAMDCTQFRRPRKDRPACQPSSGSRNVSPGACQKDELEMAQLEGWIYVPNPPANDRITHVGRSTRAGAPSNFPSG